MTDRVLEQIWMVDSADLDQTEKEVRAVADECGAIVIEAIVSTDNLATVAVDGKTFPALVRHLKPRLVYMVATKFSARDEVAAHFDEEEVDGALIELAAKWASRDGQTSRIILGLMADGVLHGIVEAADWFEDFEAEADSLAEARAEEMRIAFERKQEADIRMREMEEKNAIM